MIPIVQPSAVNSTNKEDLDPTTSGASNNSRVVEYVADGVSPSSPNAKKKKDWMKFFKSTLPLFDGHMRCDCSRDAATEQNIEHRFHQHPSRDLTLTYIQLLGSQPLSMRANLSEWIAGDDGDSSNTTSQVATSACRPQFPRGADCTLASKSDTTSLKWYFNRILLIEFVKLHLPQLRPRPTHVVMNIGLWAPLQQIAASMPEVLSSLNSLGVHVVWRATTQPAPVSSGMRRKGGVSQWLAMRNHRQLIDRVMRDKYCVVPPGVSRNDGSTNKQLLQQQKQQLCHFFRLRSLPLPSSSSREDTTTAIADDTPGGAADDAAAAPARFIGQELYVDSLAHFVPWVYGYWNKGLWQFLRSLK